MHTVRKTIYWQSVDNSESVIYTWQLFKKGCHTCSQQSILEPKGTLGTVIMSDNTPVKTVTVWLWRYIKPALQYCAKSMLIVINYLCCFNPQFLSVPVSVIDCDNLFWNSCIPYSCLHEYLELVCLHNAYFLVILTWQLLKLIGFL